MNLGQTTKVLLACVVAGAVVTAGGFLIAASNVGLFGEPSGPLLGLGVVLLIAGAIAFAVGIVGLLITAVAALLRRRR